MSNFRKVSNEPFHRRNFEDNDLTEINRIIGFAMANFTIQTISIYETKQFSSKFHLVEDSTRLISYQL